MPHTTVASCLMETDAYEQQGLVCLCACRQYMIYHRPFLCKEESTNINASQLCPRNGLGQCAHPLCSQNCLVPTALLKVLAFVDRQTKHTCTSVNRCGNTCERLTGCPVRRQADRQNSITVHPTLVGQSTLTLKIFMTLGKAY